VANAVNDVRVALARAVARNNVPDDVIAAVADQIAAAKHPIRGLDVCERGICIDFFVDDAELRATWQEMLEFDGGKLRGLEIFPWGMPTPDIFHVRVIQEFDALR